MRYRKWHLLTIIVVVSSFCFLLFSPFTLQEFPLEERIGVSYEYVKRVLSSYQDGFYSYGVCGSSVESKPIYFYSIGKGRETIMIIGGLHGNEPKGAYACLELLENLTNSESLLNELRFIVVPLANPDGAERFDRLNSRNIDLNRDFYKFSQPETQAIRDLFIDYSPVLLIDVHESLRGTHPVIIFADNEKSWHLADLFTSETGIPAFLAADVGQSANFAEREDIYGVIVELPAASWEYGNGTTILWQLIKIYQSGSVIS